MSKSTTPQYIWSDAKQINKYISWNLIEDGAWVKMICNIRAQCGRMARTRKTQRTKPTISDTCVRVSMNRKSAVIIYNKNPKSLSSTLDRKRSAFIVWKPPWAGACDWARSRRGTTRAVPRSTCAAVRSRSSCRQSAPAHSALVFPPRGLQIRDTLCTVLVAEYLYEL